MAILINDNYSLQAADKAFDDRYFNINVPWADAAEAVAGIPTYRYQGLTINIAGDEWWWKDSTSDNDLVAKSLGSVLTGVTNGLTLSNDGTYAILGGDLVDDVAINVGSNAFQVHGTEIGTGLFVSDDIVSITADGGDYSSAIGVTAIDGFASFTEINGKGSNSCAIIKTNHDSLDLGYVSGTTKNSLFIDDNGSVFTDNIHSKGLEYADDYSANKTPRWIPDWDAVTGLTSQGILTADNGLTKDINSNVSLGGDLTGDTTIGIGSNFLCICDDSDYGGLRIMNNQMAMTSSFNVDNYVGINLLSSSPLPQHNCLTMNYMTTVSCSGLIFGYNSAELKFSNKVNDNTFNITCAGGMFTDSISSKGIDYADDYRPNYTNCTLVSKEYVDDCIISSCIEASNGLSFSGDTVILGGDLTGDTTINGVGVSNLIINDVTDFNVVSTGTSICGSDNIELDTSDFSIVSTGSSICGTSCIELRTPEINFHNGIDNVINLSTTCNILYDNVNSEGFVYGANYCAVGKENPRWIPDNEYIISLSSGHMTGATNGLTVLNQSIKLGGELDEATDISLGNGSTQPFTISNTGTTTNSLFNMDGTEISINTSDINSPYQAGNVTVTNDNTIVCNGFTDCFTSIEMNPSVLNICTCGDSTDMLITDNSTTQKGIEYAADYHNTYTDRSLVDLSYVTGLTSQAILTANNGLTKDANSNVTLGGDLTGDTTIDINNNVFKIINEGGANQNGIILDSSSTGYHSLYHTTNPSVGSGLFANSGQNNDPTFFLIAKYSADNTRINGNSKSVTVGYNLAFNANLKVDLEIGESGSTYTDAINSKGIEYAADYRPNYTNCTLVSKEYVDDCIISACVEASNGLSFSNDTVVLGGDLTGDTTIDINNNVFKIINDSVNIHSGLSLDTDINYSLYHSDGIGGSGVFLNSGESPYFVLTSSCSNGGFGSSNVCGDYDSLRLGYNIHPDGLPIGLDIPTELVIDSDGSIFNDNINSKGIEYAADYSSNFTDRSLVDKGYADSLGEKNNTYAIQCVTSSGATVNTGDTFVVLVNYSGDSTITLPSYGTNDSYIGKTIKIKDSSGDALTNNITIDATAGTTIENSQCATINTDYGAFELMFVGDNKWLTLSFVN